MTATAKVKTKKPSRLMSEMLDLADDMHRTGIMDEATYKTIKMHDSQRAQVATLTELTGKDIRELREQARMSQAVSPSISI